MAVLWGLANSCHLVLTKWGRLTHRIQRIGPSLVQARACCLCSAMVITWTCGYLFSTVCMWQTSLKFQSKYEDFLTIKCISKCRLQNDTYFFYGLNLLKMILLRWYKSVRAKHSGRLPGKMTYISYEPFLFARLLTVFIRDIYCTICSYWHFGESGVKCYTYRMCSRLAFINTDHERLYC